MIKQTNIDIFLLLSILIFPALSYKIAIFGIFDDFIFLYMAIVVSYKLIYNYIIEKNFFIFIILFIAYSGFLIINNNLPLRNLFQIYIYIKFIIIFLYFHLYSDTYKVKLFNKIASILFVFFVLSLFISVLQFLIPQYFHKDLVRGVNGITLGGIFFGRIVFGEYLVVFIILLMSLKKVKIIKLNSIVAKYRYQILFLSLLMLFLTFDRKELVLVLGLLTILFYDKIKNDSKIIFYLLLGFLMIIVAIFLYYFYYDLNARTFTSKQVRLLILLNGFNIFLHYFPFGSGPGTYGSIMSLKFLDIYEKFDVPKHIYLGWDGNGGPIFDVFIISLIAEYGLGVILFFYFIYKMHNFKQNILLTNIVNIKKIRISFFITFLFIMPFVPMLLNWIGFLMFSILALLSSNSNRCRG